MFKLTTTIVNNLPSEAEFMKQTNFGTALGLTRTAKDAQAASVDAIKGTFTVRGRWFEQQNKFGIKIKPAKPADLTAEVKTAADWLDPHETGKDKHARSGRLAVPTENVRRNKRLIIPRNQRPAALRGKNTFVLQTAHGPVLFQRIKRGKRKGIVALYGLEQSVRIKKQSTFYEPIAKVVKQKIGGNIRDGIAKAFATGGNRRGRSGSYIVK